MISMPTTFDPSPGDVNPGYPPANEMTAENLPHRDVAHDILVMEIIQLISNLEVARCWVVDSVSALRA